MEGARGGNGDRRWPKQRVPFVAYMIMTMLSIADGSRNSDAVSMTDRLEESHYRAILRRTCLS
ncbi:hypothetical protein B1806_12960 [Metallibacterium scheffleri]|uniref:Uncharacterized protein n=1 Tax=Metallibacterium scheffleri TaxID=993689 RepID=A0A4S3KIW7_9GAMM|nr:hypothetical protein B1806_12960 [Metallibacterium scheffleri]